MANVLFLAHRLPYPPNKGDKVRSYHLIQLLQQQHSVYVGAFVDDARDQVHLPRARSLCQELYAPRLHKLRAHLASLAGFWRRQPLSLAHYRHAGLQRWVDELLRRVRIDLVLVYSSAMASYVRQAGVPVLIDFVDADSAKWAAYAPRHRWPMSWIYRREARLLAAEEHRQAAAARAAFFVTRRELAAFHGGAAGDWPQVGVAGNGVDTNFFCPLPKRASPFAAGEPALVFTGAMDYLPNVDAVCWFVQQVLPTLRQQRPGLRLHVVGRHPTAAVRALAGDAVQVTGAVDDVRPYLQHATVVVAPMRLARGIHNKILEAMAMGRPVVVSAPCLESLDVDAGTELLAADSADAFVTAVQQLLQSPAKAAAMGGAARQRMCKDYQWKVRLAPIAQQVQALCPAKVGA